MTTQFFNFVHDFLVLFVHFPIEFWVFCLSICSIFLHNLDTIHLKSFSLFVLFSHPGHFNFNVIKFTSLFFVVCVIHLFKKIILYPNDFKLVSLVFF